MKKRNILLSIIIGSGSFASFAQSAIDAYNVAQPDMKGTARYMGMAGAFGALGGDLSSISQNPAGIGVYRSSDVGFTLDLDIQNSNSTAQGMNFGNNQTKFLLNNIGAVLTMRLPSKTFPNFNFGFTYNKGASFNRVYSGGFNTLSGSMSNYIAGLTTSEGLLEGDLETIQGVYDPYLDSSAPWISILGYDSYLISPTINPSTGNTQWVGLWDNNSMLGGNTAGSGSYYLKEQGGTNDFNIVFGGNIANVLYWGMNFDIVNINYQLGSYWGESLTDALVPADNNSFLRGPANWNLNNIYRLSGTGFNYQLGFIVKPVQQLRFGFAFHTPTWYNLNEEFGSNVNYDYGGDSHGTIYANEGYLGYNSYNLRTPRKIIASAAGVISDNFIVSFDYEWANYGSMRFSEPNYYDGYDWYEPWNYAMAPSSGYKGFDPYDPYAFENNDMSTYYKSTNTFRVGVEFKPISSLSLRAGYANVSSPVKKDAANNNEMIYTAGTTLSYRFDNSTNYVTCGVGYRYKHVYVDLAYVFKKMDSTFHAYSPLLYDEYNDLGYLYPADKNKPDYRQTQAPQSKVSFKNNQIVLSMGYRF